MIIRLVIGMLLSALFILTFMASIRPDNPKALGLLIIWVWVATAFCIAAAIKAAGDIQ